MGPKTKLRARILSLPQRPRPKRLILRPRMFLPPNRAKKKTPQGQEVALRTYLVFSFVVFVVVVVVVVVFFFL